MLLDIPSPMNDVINSNFTVELVDICFNNTLQILCKLLPTRGSCLGGGGAPCSKKPERIN